MSPTFPVAGAAQESREIAARAASENASSTPLPSSEEVVHVNPLHHVTVEPERVVVPVVLGTDSVDMPGRVPTETADGDALERGASNSALAPKVVRVGASRRVTRAAKRLSHAHVNAAAVQAAAFALRSELKSTQRRSGGRGAGSGAVVSAIRSLIGTLNTHPTDVGVAEVVCEAMAAASAHAVGPAALAEAGAAAALNAALANHGATSNAVLLNASKAVAAAAATSEDFAVQFLASDGSAALVRGLVGCSADDDTYRRARPVCDAISALSMHEGAISALTSAGALEALADFASVPASSSRFVEAVLGPALSAIANLVLDDVALDRFIRAGGASSVVTLIERPGASAALVARAAAALCSMSTRNAGATALGATGATAALYALRLAVSLQHDPLQKATHLGLLETSCWALRNLTLERGGGGTAANALVAVDGALLLHAALKLADIDNYDCRAHVMATLGAMTAAAQTPPHPA